MSRSKISESESGKSPSILIFNLLGNYAAKQGRYDEAFWFWEQAKLDTDVMLLAANVRLNKRNAPAGIVSVPAMPNIAGQEKPESADVFQLDRSVVPHEAETSYLRVPGGSFVPRMLHPQDIVVIDSFETDPWKLEGSLVAAYRSPELRDEKVQREFEKSSTKEEVSYRRSLGMHPFQRFGMFVGWLQPHRLEDNVHLYLTGIVSPDGAEVREQVAFWSGYYSRRDPADRGLPLSLKILGRVLSCFPSQTPDLLANKSPKR